MRLEIIIIHTQGTDTICNNLEGVDVSTVLVAALVLGCETGANRVQSSDLPQFAAACSGTQSLARCCG
eukprot:COSAG05_NODE_3583_length_1979_cov_6.405851_1_plen_67_part_10